MLGVCFGSLERWKSSGGVRESLGRVWRVGRVQGEFGELGEFGESLGRVWGEFGVSPAYLRDPEAVAADVEVGV